jgi:hypothetical protein
MRESVVEDRADGEGDVSEEERMVTGVSFHI